MVLSLAIWLPIFFGLLVLLFGSDRETGRCALAGADRRRRELPRDAAADHRLRHRDCRMQFVEHALDRALQHPYHLGVDGISMWFVPLTAFITVIVVISPGK
jgi:NADH-quinone oxidoreductase subunit M